MAEKVKKLQAICRDCGHNASFSFRMIQSELLEVIGGGDIYKPLCRECFTIQTALQKNKLPREVENNNQLLDDLNEDNKEAKNIETILNKSTSSSGCEQNLGNDVDTSSANILECEI